MVKYGCALLGLKSAILQLKNKLMKWADFLHAGCDGSFWLEHDYALYLWVLNTGAPL